MAMTTAQLMASTPAEILTAWGGHEGALGRMYELMTSRAPLTSEQRVERDQLNACFSDLERIVERAKGIRQTAARLGTY